MDPFIIKVILSLVIGIVWVIISASVAERISGKIGGLLIGLPSTAVISLLFVGLTQGVPAALIASSVILFSSGLYCFYYISYLLLTKKGFLFGFIGSLIVWFFFAIVAVRFTPNNFLLSTVLWLFLITPCIWWTVKNIHIEQKLMPKNKINSPIWLKAIITGAVISLIVVISKIAGPKWGGVFATFPALATSTFLITLKSGGIEFTRLIAKNILISTTTTIGIYAIFCHFLYPITGVILGTILAYFCLLLISLPLYFLIFERIKE